MPPAEPKLSGVLNFVQPEWHWGGGWPNSSSPVRLCSIPAGRRYWHPCREENCACPEALFCQGTVPSMSSPKSSPWGQVFSFLLDSWSQGIPSPLRAHRWVSRLAACGESGNPAVLTRRWPGHCRVLAIPPGLSGVSRAQAGWLQGLCGPFGSARPSIRFDSSKDR